MIRGVGLNGGFCRKFKGGEAPRVLIGLVGRDWDSQIFRFVYS